MTKPVTKDIRKAELAVRRWSKRNATKAAALPQIDAPPAPDVADEAQMGPAQIPALPDVSQWWELQLQTRQSDVGFFTALFPWASDADVRKRFDISRNTLTHWKTSDAYRQGYDKGIQRRSREQEEAAKGFFKSRVMDYAKRLDELAMGADSRVALAAVTRILESQGALDQTRTSIVNVAIQLQQGMAAELGAGNRPALPQSSGIVVDGTMRELGKGVIQHGEVETESVVQQGQGQGRQGDAL